MFDLEQSIADWRKQMIAAGIKAPVPLEELESHLREEFERQIQSGASEQEAFQRTVLQIGRPKELKTEFLKGGHLFSLLGNNKFMAIDRILGTLWLVLFCWGFVTMSRLYIWRLTSGHAGESLVLRFDPVELLQLAIWGAGILGSILVIRGTKLGRWIVGSIAGLYTLFMLSVLFHLIQSIRPFSVVEVGSFAAFYAITAGLMLLPRHSNVMPARH